MSTDRTSWIAYVGPIAFPEGDAGTRRVWGIVRSLCAAGYRVHVAAGLSPASESAPIPEAELSYSGMGEYDRNWSPFRKLKYSLWDCGNHTLRWLNTLQEKPALVVMYGSPLPLARRTIGWCREHSVPLIGDVVEWYSGSHVPGGRFGPVHLCNEYTLRRLLPQCDGLIAISSYLENHYKTCGMQVLRVPPTLDVQAVATTRADRHTGTISLVYAGVPGKKDLLGNVLAALAQVDPEGRRFRLQVIGPGEAALQRSFPGYITGAVSVLGRQPHAEVLRRVGESDFSILLRPNQRYANAGFPTKVAESLSCGTPVMCNLTSDLAEHIRDGETGIVCRDESVAAFTEALQTASTLSDSALAAMRQAARQQALRAFDYRQYAQPLARFAESIISGACQQMGEPA